MLLVFLNTVRFGYNELGYSEQFLRQIGHFSTQINRVITNKNVLSCAVRYNRV